MLQQSIDPRVPRGQISFLLGRIHVGTPYREVRDDIDSRARKVNLPEEVRRGAIRYAMATHYDNRTLYREVTSGRFSGPETLVNQLDKLVSS